MHLSARQKLGKWRQHVSTTKKWQITSAVSGFNDKENKERQKIWSTTEEEPHLIYSKSWSMKMKLKQPQVDYSSVLSWTSPTPHHIRLDLADLPKSPNITSKKHIKAIVINDFPSHPLCYTDGSKSGLRTGTPSPSMVRSRTSLYV